jgi:hypothetical protein
VGAAHCVFDDPIKGVAYERHTQVKPGMVIVSAVNLFSERGTVTCEIESCT